MSTTTDVALLSDVEGGEEEDSKVSHDTWAREKRLSTLRTLELSAPDKPLAV